MLECRSPHNLDKSAGTSLSASSSRSNSKLRPSCRLPPTLTAPRHRGIGHRRGRCSAICRRVVASAERYNIPPPPNVQNAERIPWQDSSTDVAFIGMCRKAYGKLAGWQSDADWKDGEKSYRGMIEVSRALMRVRRSVCNAHRHPGNIQIATSDCNMPYLKATGPRDMQGKTAEQQRDAVIAGFPQVMLCAEE